MDPLNLLLLFFMVVFGHKIIRDTPDGWNKAQKNFLARTLVSGIIIYQIGLMASIIIPLPLTDFIFNCIVFLRLRHYSKILPTEVAPVLLEKPKSTRHHDQLAFIALSTVAFGIFNQLRSNHYSRWTGHNIAHSRDYDVTYWLLYQGYIYLILTLTYRLLSQDDKKSLEYFTLILKQITYKRLFSSLFLLFLNSVIQDLLQPNSHFVLYVYSFLYYCLVYSLGIAVLLLVLIYADLVVYGYSQQEVWDHLSHINIENIFSSEEKEKEPEVPKESEALEIPE